jgi:glycosyltransferase involved in cell wall biosynthesis
MDIAILIPCYNEETAIYDVVSGFYKALPQCRIFVYDNNSTDATAEKARQAGAHVRTEPLQGKGNVVRRMFADIDADIYVLVDGDLTYDPVAAPHMVELVRRDRLDMIVGIRVAGEGAYRRGHQFGNRLFNRLVRDLFGRGFTDILSGYRVLSRRFVKSFPAASRGFEIETELAIHALDLRVAIAEVAVPYGARPANSTSKLSTWRDGFKIIRTISRMYRTLKPARFYGGISLAFLVSAFVLAVPIVFTWLDTGLVPRLPTAVLIAAFLQVSVISLACGFILSAIAETRREARRLRYLEFTPPSQE